MKERSSEVKKILTTFLPSVLGNIVAEYDTPIIFREFKKGAPERKRRIAALDFEDCDMRGAVTEEFILEIAQVIADKQYWAAIVVKREMERSGKKFASKADEAFAIYQASMPCVKFKNANLQNCIAPGRPM
jgi:hypothetical protein